METAESRVLHDFNYTKEGREKIDLARRLEPIGGSALEIVGAISTVPTWLLTQEKIARRELWRAERADQTPENRGYLERCRVRLERARSEIQAYLKKVRPT